MVSRNPSLKTGLSVVLLALAAVLLAGLLAPATAAEKPTMNEEYRVTINDVGDARIVDTIKYSKEDYSYVKKVEKENQGFLTRRFTTDDNTGEMLDFKADLDDGNRSVIITYEKPGYAYTEKGRFAIYGLPDKPKSEKGTTFTFEEKSTINSEFTLFTDQVILTRSVFELPGAASNARYDAEEEAILYEMPPASAQVGFFSANKTALSLLFGILTLAFAGGLAFVATRKPAAPPSAAVADASAAPPAPPGVSAPASPAVGAVQPPAAPAPPTGTPGSQVPSDGPVAPPTTVGDSSAGQAAAGTAAPGKKPVNFCRKCGAKMSRGRKFCTKCGTHV